MDASAAEDEMGVLVEGAWRERGYDTERNEGRFIRWDSAFRNWVTADGSAGPSGVGGFAAEAGRFRLYVSLACPWAHRALMLRRLKGLEEMIPVSVVHWLMREGGWSFRDGPGVIQDPVFGADYLHQVYAAAKPDYSGRVSVPVLFDTKTGRIVSNESSEIIRMMNSAFDAVGAAPGDYYPAAHRAEIDAVNARVYDTLNNGVYKAGFATRQRAYEEAVVPLFETLDWLEERLSRQRYLVGGRLTEADVRLFTTLIRFDPVYVGHFKCNLRRLVDYPALWAYTRDLYQRPEIRPTVDLEHIKRHYHESHESVNPSAITPLGPLLDHDAPHGRERLL